MDHYLLLDRSDPDRPVWVLTSTVGLRRASLDVVGHYSSQEWAEVVSWIASALGPGSALLYVAGPLVFRVET